jgi:hypothetical protein
MANELDNMDWKTHFDDFLDVTQQERERAEARRDYRDLKQWTTAEVEKLEARGQAPIVFDQFGKKVDAITGLEVQRRTDPKAYPVKPRYDKASEAITDALRYVESNTSFDATASEVFEDKIVEGYGGVIVEVDSDTLDIEVNSIPWDRIYFDPFARAKNFTDARYMGITLWMDVEDAVKINPEKKDEIKALVDQNQFDDTTFEDRPSNWININRKRVRINQEYYNDGKQWMEVFYTGDTVIKGPDPSPYLDDRNEPSNPISLQSDFIDRDNNRYGYMERLKDVQDEINHRRSRALFLLDSKTIIADRGAFGDVPREVVLEEARKGMAYLEPIQGTRVEIDSQSEMGQAQLGFYQDAQGAMDSVGINPELAGRTDNAISGRAFIARQEGGMLELTRIFARHSEWKTRVYRQIWSRIKQFWTDEKWVRVTDNDESMRFVGLNIPIRRVDKLLEQQSGMDIEELKAKDSQQVEAFIQQEIAQDPLMGEVVETRNNIVEMDMDIIVEEAPDTISLQQEQFDTLAQLAGTRADPKMFEALVRLSSMSNKDEVLDLIKGDDKQAEAQAQAQQQAMQVEMADKAADIDVKQSNAAKAKAEVQEILSNIPLNQAKAKDEMASAIERIGKVSSLPVQ